MSADSKHTTRQFRAKGIVIGSQTIIAVCVFILAAMASAHAEEGESWTETTKYNFNGPGTYGSSFVSIFAGSQNNTVVDVNGVRINSIVSSFNSNSGSVLVNQDTGNINNQANIHSYVIGGLSNVSVVDLASLATHHSTNNTTVTVGGIRKNEISQSFQGTKGVVSINQSSGNLNSQANVFQLGLGLSNGPGAIALDDKTLASVKTQNTGSDEGSTSKSDIVNGNSFDRFSGVAQVTQSSGDQNAIRNTTSISVTARTIK